MARKGEEARRRLQVIQTTAALYSLIFVAAISYGYVVLLQGAAGWLAYVIGLVLAAIAWSLARYIGGEEGGIKKYAPLFALLLTISALGVFNTMLATFESKNILSEAVDSSYARYSKLAGAVSQAQDELGISERSAAIDAALGRLTAEIKNPMNCGQGPVAMAAISQLSDLLPGFSPLSRGNTNGCDQADALAAAYTTKVNELKAAAPWNDRDLQALALASETGLRRLKEAKGKVRDGPDAIVQVKSVLESLAPDYQAGSALLLAKNKGSNLPPTLDLRQVESIGEWSQVVNLILGRLNQASTYFYLLVAIFADWMMVYLFSLVRENKATAPNMATGQNPRIKPAW
jgi:hypothetical protein